MAAGLGIFVYHNYSFNTACLYHHATVFLSRLARCILDFQLLLTLGACYLILMDTVIVLKTAGARRDEIQPRVIAHTAAGGPGI